MFIVNYNEIKRQLNERCIDKMYIEQIINNDETKLEILSSLLKLDSTKKITYLKQIILSDFIILEYELVDLENNKQTSNTMIVKNDLPVIKLEHYEKCNYCEDNYSIYNVDNNHLSNRLTFSRYEMDNNCYLSVSVLGKFADSNDINSYFTKKYNVYISDNKISAINTNNNMYIDTENGFNNIVNTFTNLINKFYLKFDQRVDSLNNDDVKEYHISRKK